MEGKARWPVKVFRNRRTDVGSVSICNTIALNCT